MRIDRAVQVKILELLAEHYPNRAPQDLWNKLLNLADNNEECLNTNLFYLIKSGCIEDNCLSRALDMPGPSFCPGLISLTNTGQDYLADDGGLTAFKNTVTVRFHADALAALEKCILHGTESPETKNSLLAKLRQLPFSATEHLMKKLLDVAVLHSPEALLLIKNALL